MATDEKYAAEHGERNASIHDLDDNADLKDFKADAIRAEEEEHNMTVLETVKAYPMASFWAFVMSCTIVSYRDPVLSP